MDKDPSTLPDDIYHILADTTDHEVNEINVEEAGESFKNLLRQRLTKREVARGEAVLRFSALGKKDRQLWYAANMPEVAEKMPGKQNFKFLYGDVIELLLIFLAMEAGHDVQDNQRKVEVNGVKGSMDATIDGVVVDIKSASSFSFDKFKSGAYVFDDPFGYVSQISGYANAIGNDRAGFLVADKVHGDIAFVELDKAYIEGNKPEPRIAHLRNVIASETPPKRCYDSVPEGKSGNMKLGIGCSYCVSPETKILKSDLTWADADTVMVGDSLVGFEGVGRDKMLHTKVLAVKAINLPRVKVETEVGDIIVSEDHLFVSKTPSGALPKWRKADELSPGYLIKYFGAPWETDTTPEGGYLRGFFDGEGCWSNHKLAWAQNPGPVFDYVDKLMADRGFGNYQKYTKNDAGCMTCRIKGSFYDAYKAMGSLRPIRLLPKAIESLATLTPRSYLMRQPAITNLVPLEVGPVIAIETDSGTLITNGFFSHNCSFKETCWSDANKGQGLRKFFYSRGPVFLTAVVREPKVGEA